MSNPEVEVIGMLPGEPQQITIYSAGVTASARQPAAASVLIRALSAPSARPIYKAKGLDPICCPEGLLALLQDAIPSVQAFCHWPASCIQNCTGFIAGIGFIVAFW